MGDEGRDRIVIDPDVQGGRPVVRGTRIPVDVIQGLAAHGYDGAAIVAELPGLEPADVEAALAYR